MNNVLPSTWSDAVANDPKHRPQFWDRPSTTVRKEWCRRPQEAHIAEENRYRRLSVEEIALIQGFSFDWVNIDGLKENDRIALLGNAVAPPVSKAIAEVLAKHDKFKSKSLIEICAGIGGLSGSFKYLKPIAKIEIWDIACKVLRADKPWPASCVVEGSAQDFDYSAHKGKVGLLCGGPPCQPWSQAGRQKGAEDPRDVMGFTPEAISACEPDVFLFENVPGLLTAKQHQAYLKNLLERLKEPRPGLRYGMAYAVLNAADYGVPQVRKRVFILGFKGESNTFANRVMHEIQEAATHHDPAKPALGKKPWVTLRQALVGIQINEPWRRWNLTASQGQEFIVDVEEKSAVENNSASNVIVLQKEISPPMQNIDRIGLVWPGKDKAIRYVEKKWRFIDQQEFRHRHSLIWQETIGSGPGPINFAVKGDYTPTIEALASYLRGEARMVYFDSPHRDVFGGATEAGYVDSTWLSLVRDTARAACRCLAHDGFFILHTEEDSAHYGRMVLDEVFGHESHVTTLAWQKKYGPQSDRLGPTDAFDYLIVYSKCHRDNIKRIGLLESPDNIIDDGDWRGCYTAGHKGARSGSEKTKFTVNMPPYRWEILDQKLPKGRHWFDAITGVLWFESTEEAGEFFVKVKVTDAKGKTSEATVPFAIEEKKRAGDKYELPDRIWWLLKKDNDIKASGALKIDTKNAPRGLKGEPYSLILKAEGGAVFAGKQDAPGSGRYWEFSASTLIGAIAEARASFGVKGTALPSAKTYYDRNDAKRVKSVLNWMPWQEFGKSEDATRHLKVLASKGYGSASVESISKPEPALYHLLRLFAPEDNDIVVSLGDSNASMASVAVKSGKRAIHLIGPTEKDWEIWNKTAKPRLEAVLAKKDVGGINDPEVLEGFVQAEPGLIHLHKLSDTYIQYNGAGSVVRLESASGEAASDFYAGCVGCTKLVGAKSPWYSGLMGHWAYVLEHSEILDHVLLNRIVRERPGAKRIYVIAERSDISDEDPLPPNVQLIHAPFDLAGKVFG